MPKRPYSEDDVVQPIKKQQNTKLKSRKITSVSSERTLQLLYQGAAKHENHENKKEPQKMTCSGCCDIVISKTNCYYCERYVCMNCENMCYKCSERFCSNCSFCTYDENEAVCYSCNS